MQAALRTPSSILRKRANKENEGKENKRNKMRGRRVSFAPDEELETMHLYQKDKSRLDDDDMQVTDDLAARMPQALFAHGHGGSYTGHQQNMAVPPQSPGNNTMSPLSMDLTNNSMDIPRGVQQPAGVPSLHGEFTRSITGNIPALSTLVEEDEEAGLDSVGFLNSNAQSGRTPDGEMSMELTGPTPRRPEPQKDLFSSFLSPAPNMGLHDADAVTPTSPFVLSQMMQGGGVNGVEDDTEDLKNKWGFTPGADDTLDVSHGRLVMGDTTYNHVYGNATTGDITNAMRVQAADGPARTATSRMAIAATANHAMTNGPAFAHMMDSAASRRESGAPQTQPQHQNQQQPVGEMTINLLADDNHTDLWRQPMGLNGHGILQTGRPSIASSRPVVPATGETTNLLNGTTNLLPAGNAAVRTTGTMGGYTMQLLAEGATTKGVLEQYMQQVQTGKPQHQQAAYTHEPTAVSSSMLAAAANKPLPLDITAGSVDFALAAHTGGLLDEQQLTLDDFSVPPELAPAAHQSHAAATAVDGSLPLSQQLSQQLARMTNQGDNYSQGAGGGSQPLASLPVAYGGRNSQNQTFGEMEQMRGSQLMPPEQNLPPITFQEFLALVEVRFMDDLRRRTSFVQPFEGFAIAEQPAPTTLAEALAATYINNVRGGLMQKTIEELAERVETLQANTTESEVALARSNPRAFYQAQTATSIELDRVRDQMKLLKRVCRHRTMMAWKQSRIEYEQQLGQGYRNAMVKLEAEAAAMKGFLSQAVELEDAINTVHSAILRRVQQEHTDFQVAQAARERKAYQRQRVEDMAAANDSRARKLAELQAEQRTMQSLFEGQLQEKAALEQQLQQLQGDGATVAATPGALAREQSGLDAKVAEAAELYDIMSGLQGVQLDARQFSEAQGISMTVQGKFLVRVETGDKHLGSSAISGGNGIAVSVAVLPAGFADSSVARALLPHLAELCSCTTPATKASLPAVLDKALGNITTVSNACTQLEAAMLQCPSLTRITVEASQTSSLSGLDITLWFTACDAVVAKMAVTIPLSVFACGLTAPSTLLRARAIHPSAGAAARSVYAQEQLQAVPSGHRYVQRMCQQAGMLVAAGLKAAGL